MERLKRIGRALGLVRRRVQILVVGLDNSGKSTIIARLAQCGRRQREHQDIAPTVGYREETINFGGRGDGNLQFQVVDMSGQSRYRTLWEQYYESADALIFVVDSTDRLRICQVQDELTMMLGNDRIRGSACPVLFFANKTDVPSSLSPSECLEMLDLGSIDGHPWHIQGSNALTGDGLDDGVSWLADQILSRREKTPRRK